MLGDEAVQLLLIAPWMLGVCLLLLGLRTSYPKWARISLRAGAALAFTLAVLMALAAAMSF
jgi:hypothetical protein